MDKLLSRVGLKPRDITFALLVALTFVALDVLYYQYGIGWAPGKAPSSLYSYMGQVALVIGGMLFFISQIRGALKKL